ncbi:hypothetical protein ZOD2009_15651 [Haladaptatus paucihalophilus DX253]|uniref:Uncharacterized protein n=1 Tax=Haladaptatus paucihalophilus DX253 TaxID=797209 RepID=E7QWE2_HALPU|nr:hypothetical protein ZOD2009_15651 [Haladaptatus paucihalophilus DX253]
MHSWSTELSGASWQIVPAVISEFLQNTDAENRNELSNQCSK